MEITKDPNRKISAQLKDLEVGDVLVCEPADLMKCQAYGSKYGFILGRSFTTQTDKERRVVLLKRTE